MIIDIQIFFYYKNILSVLLRILDNLIQNKSLEKPIKNKVIQGFPIHETSGIRTPDNLIKSQVLYRLS